MNLPRQRISSSSDCPWLLGARRFIAALPCLLLPIAGWALGVFLLAPAFAKAQAREWEDSLGNQLTAELVGLVGEFLWLATPQGQLIEVRREELSRADQRWVLEQETVIQANAEAGLPQPYWLLNQLDGVPQQVLRTLVAVPLELSATERGSLAETLASWQRQLRRGSPETWNVSLRLEGNVDPTQVVALSLAPTPAYAALRKLALAHRLSYSIEGRDIVFRR